MIFYQLIKKVNIFIFYLLMLIFLNFNCLYAQDNNLEGKRGKLNIDFKSKINFIKEGRKHLELKNLNEALYFANYAIKDNCDTYEAYLLLADIYNIKGDLVSEAYALKYVIDNSPNERLKKLNEKRLEKILKHIENNKITKSAKNFLNSESKILGSIKLGNTFEELNNNKKAMIHYDYLSLNYEKLKSSRLAKIKLLLKENKLNEAKSIISEYFKIVPNDTMTVYLLVENGLNIEEIKRLGYNGEGLDLRKYNRLYANYFYKKGYLKYYEEQYNEAKMLFNHSLSYFKSNYVAHNFLANIYYQNGEFDKALTHYMISYYYNPTNYEVLFNALKSSIFIKKYDIAKELLKKLISIAPDEFEYTNLMLMIGLKDEEIKKLGYKRISKNKIVKDNKKQKNTQNQVILESNKNKNNSDLAPFDFKF